MIGNTLHFEIKFFIGTVYFHLFSNSPLPQVLGVLLYSKSHLINISILHLTYALVGTVSSEHKSACIPNPIAFRDLLAGVCVCVCVCVCACEHVYEHVCICVCMCAACMCTCTCISMHVRVSVLGGGAYVCVCVIILSPSLQTLPSGVGPARTSRGPSITTSTSSSFTAREFCLLGMILCRCPDLFSNSLTYKFLPYVVSTVYIVNVRGTQSTCWR